MEKTKNKNVSRLCNNIELFVDRKMKTPKDFKILSDIILSRSHLYVSPTTLKRMWGYLNETTSIRTSTLDILSKFLGYTEWTDFCKYYCRFNSNLQEGGIAKAHLSVNALKVGEKIKIDWMPKSSCTLEYLGNYTFKIITGTYSNLKNGDLIHCFYVIEGQPLYLTDSTIKGKEYDVYCIGKIGGVTFETFE